MFSDCYLCTEVSRSLKYQFLLFQFNVFTVPLNLVIANDRPTNNCLLLAIFLCVDADGFALIATFV